MNTLNGYQKLKVLTNHPGQDSSPTWKKYTHYISSEKNENHISAIRLGFRLYFNRKKYDCIVLGAGRSDYVFAILQSLLPFKRKPTIMIDCLWYDTGSMIKRFARKIIFKFFDKGVDRYCVWAKREIDAYSEAFNISKKKFIFVPYHTTLDNQISEGIVKDEGYLFSGGNFKRDYNTFLKAVKKIPVQVEIACTRPEIFKDLEIPENVSINGYSHSEYLKKMAGCKVSIIPLYTNHLHSGGQQTILNSMWMGKPTVVTDPDGACDYIVNGVDGILVPSGKPDELEKAIIELIEKPDYANIMGQKAKEKVKGFYSTEVHFQKIILIVKNLLNEKMRT